MLAHGAGKTEYVPLHTAAAFSSDGADWNTDFIKQGLWVGRISFQITQGFQVLSFTGESPESWREISRHPDFSCEAGLECGKGMLCVVLFWLSLIGAHSFSMPWWELWNIIYSTVQEFAPGIWAGRTPTQHGFHRTQWRQLDWDFQNCAAISILPVQLKHEL